MRTLIVTIAVWASTSFFGAHADWAFPSITHTGPRFLLMSESQFSEPAKDGTPSLPRGFRSFANASIPCGHYMIARRYEAMTNIAWTLQVTELAKRDGTPLVIEVALFPPAVPGTGSADPFRSFHAFFGEAWHSEESPDSTNRRRSIISAVRDGFTAPDPERRLGDCAPGAFEPPARASS